MKVLQQLFARSRSADKIARIEPAEFRDVMREIASPVAIVAAGSPGRRNGLTATAVCSVSDTPPTVLVCVRRSARAHDDILAPGCFSINFLSADQEDVAVQFSGARGIYGEDRFAAGDWATGISGAPILREALCTLECQLAGTQLVATHSIIFGELVDTHKCESIAALLYRRGRYQSLPQLSAGRRLHDPVGAGEGRRAVSVE